MNCKCYNVYMKTFFILLVAVIFSIKTATAHEDKKIGHPKHKPIICVLMEDRKWHEKLWCKDQLKRHRLCKMDQHCAIIKLEEQQKEIDELENKIANQKPVDCKNLAFNHVALKNGNIYQKPSGDSTVLKKIKKGQEEALQPLTNLQSLLTKIHKNGKIKLK